MAEVYKVLRFDDGAKLYLPDTIQDKGLRQQSPSRMIEIGGGLTQSTVKGFETYSEVLTFYYNYGSVVSGLTGGQQYIDSGMNHSLFYLAILDDARSPLIRQAVNSHKSIPTIKLVRLGNLTDMTQPLKTETYFDCLITKVAITDDYLGLAFRFSKVQDEAKETNQKTAQAGQNVSTHDYTTNEKE